MKEYKIVVDSREQLPLWKTNTVVKKLDVGDYSIEGYEDKISVERKSLADLYGTLGSGHKRFKAELQRAESYEYFGIVVDGSFTSAYKKDFPGSYHSKMKGFVITAIIFTLHVKYKIPIFFAQDRTESKQIIKHIFNAYMKQQK